MGKDNNGFTDKQKAFIEHYIICLNGTEAARKAKYSGDYYTLAAQASRLLNNAKIREAIDLRLKANQIKANEVLQRLADQAAGLGSEYYLADGSIDFKKVLENDKGHLIKGITQTKYGPTIHFYDAQKALEILAKHLNLTPDQATVIIKQLKNVSIDDL